MKRSLLEENLDDMTETEGARRASGVSVAAARDVPDPEVVEKPKRRRFSAGYQLRIVREADACKAPGEVGALLRREGLYSSLLSAWRRQRDAGALASLDRRCVGRRQRTLGSSGSSVRSPSSGGSSSRRRRSSRSKKKLLGSWGSP